MEKLTESLLVANWKMNPQTVREAKELFLTVKKSLGRVTTLGELVIAVPALYLSELSALGGKNPILSFGAQDVSSEKMGAFTGETSVGMLASLGVSHVIIGHSERRSRGETDAEIEKKVALALKADMTAIVCVGERERDTQGKYFGFIENQVRSAFRSVPGSKLTQVAIAYEPIWAISTSTPGARAATPEDAHEMTLFIRKVLTDLYSRVSADRVRILYGGSVDQKNIASFVARSGAQGYLVGGASLRPADFVTIVKTVYG